MKSIGTVEKNPPRQKLFYGWIIVLAATLIYAIVDVPILSYGIFVKPMAKEFGWSRGVTTGAFSLYMLNVGVFGILGGILVDRIGPKKLNLIGGALIGIGLYLTSHAGSIWGLYIGYSFLGGIGFAFIFVPNQTTLTRWFVAKKGLALGVMFAGGGLGGLVFTPILQSCIEAYGWRVSFVILAGLVFAIAIPAALFLKKGPEEIGLLPLGEETAELQTPSVVLDSTGAAPAVQPRNLTVREALKTRAFWLYNAAITLMFLGFFMAQVNMVPHATDAGVPGAVAALALGLAAGINALGRLLMGGVSDKIGTKPTLFICLALGTLMLFFLISVKTTLTLYLFAVLFGLAYGGSTPQMPRLISELFGVRSMGGIMGVATLITSLGPALGPVLGGAIYDRTGSYSMAFATGGGAILVALLFIAMIKMPQKPA